MKARPNYFFTLFLLVFSHPVFSQNTKIDSLRQVLQNKNLSDTVWIKTTVALAWEIRYDHMEEAGKYAEEAIPKAEKLNRYSDMAMAHKILGILNDETSHYTESIKHYLKAIDFYNKVRDTLGASRSEANIGMLYRKLSQPQEAIKYFRKSGPVFYRFKFAQGMNLTNQNMGISYFTMKNYDSALFYFLRSKEVVEAYHLNDESVYGNIANCYSTKKDLTNAEKYMKICIDRHIAAHDSSVNFYFWKQNLGKLYAQMGRHAEALTLLKEAVAGNTRLGLKYSEGSVTLHESLAAEYFLMRELLPAYKTMATAMSIKDSVFSADFGAQMNEMKEKYEADKKELNIANLEKEKQLKDVEIKHQSTQKYAMAIGLLFTLISLSLLYKSFSQKKKDNKIIQLQKDVVDQKNKEILDSITYAKRLQDAILPHDDYINAHLPDNFVLYKPKDIVAGDFYWMDVNSIMGTRGATAETSVPNSELTIIAAADSTGHGVPGAMVSVVCSNALQRAVKEFDCKEPGAILDKSRELVLETFLSTSSDVKDGMDISLLSIHRSFGDQFNKKQCVVKWSGANNPLWYIVDGEMKEIVSNKQAIGQTDKPSPFTTHTIDYKEGMSFYLFTDGFADQFGGPKGKKFKYKQLQQLLVSTNALSASEQKKILNEKFEEWKGNLEQVDDVCIIGLRI